MEISLDCTCKINLETPTLKEILSQLSVIIPNIVGQLIYAVVLSFTEKELQKGKSRFVCSKCGSNDRFRWKTRSAKETSLKTELGIISFPDIQIYCACCGTRKVIARELLGVEPRSRIPMQTIRKLALIGSLTTYGVARKIASLFGAKLNKMTVWRAVQKIGKGIEFSLDPEEKAAGEADGTGIPIRGIKKHGREIKVFLQLKKVGGCRIAGLSIGKYGLGWEKLFQPLTKQLQAFEKFILVTDGDESILKGISKKVTVIFQRCLWHIPHQFKWCGWKDKVSKKSSEWLFALTQLIDILDVSRLRLDDESCLQSMIKLKKGRYEELIEYCREKGWKKSVSYFENAKPDLFRGVENKLTNKTQSHAERVMRTTKMRTGFGKWNPESALNCIKIRLAYYYNGWDA